MSTKYIYRPQNKIDYSSYLYLIPAFIFYLVFVFFPLADTFYNSFTEWNGISEKKWVGLEQYAKNIQNKKITSSIKHSFILIIFYSILPIIIGLLIAGLMIRVKVHGMSTYRAILFLPQILSMIVVGIAWRWIYAPKGPLNSGLDFFGLEEVSRAWLGSFDYALPFVGLISRLPSQDQFVPVIQRIFLSLSLTRTEHLALSTYQKVLHGIYFRLQIFYFDQLGLSYQVIIMYQKTIHYQRLIM